MTIILSNLNRFAKIFSGRFLRKFADKWILEIPSHLAYVATLPCETLMSGKQAINDKLLGSVYIYLRLLLLCFFTVLCAPGLGAHKTVKKHNNNKADLNG